MATPTFSQYLLSRTWEQALQLMEEGDDYYHVAPTEPRGSTDSPSAGPMSRLRATLHRYVMNSSKTRLLVHGSAAAYILLLLTHASFYVPVSVTYAEDKYVKLDKAEAAKSAFPFCPLRAIRGLLRRVLFAPTVSSSSSSVGDSYAALNAASASSAPLLLYQSREGMQLLMRERTSSWLTTLHEAAGTLLLPLSIFQTETVFYMRYRRASRPREQTAAKAEPPSIAPASARNAHCAMGCASVLSMACMCAAGLSMRHASLFSFTASGAGASAGELRRYAFDFGRAIVYFAMPWGVFTAGIIITSQAKKTIPHAILGSLVTKACLAVPLARTLGGALQKFLRVHVRVESTEQPLAIVQSVPGELERVYYASIGVAAVAVGAWAVADIVKLLQRAHIMYEQDTAKRKT